MNPDILRQLNTKQKESVINYSGPSVILAGAGSGKTRVLVAKVIYLIKEKNNRTEVIVSFLAMLELVKQGMVRVNQDKHFEDISIESENNGVPMYY